MSHSMKPYEVKDLEVGEIEEQEGNYKISIKYKDVFGNIVTHIFLTQDPKIETAISNTNKKLLTITERPSNLLTGKLNGVGGIIVDENGKKLETGSSFMVSIWKGNFNTTGQYWVNLKNLIDPKITYIFTTNKRQNKNPFPGKLSSEITIKSRTNTPNQFEVIIKGIDIIGNECDVEGTLVVENK